MATIQAVGGYQLDANAPGALLDVVQAQPR